MKQAAEREEAARFMRMGEDVRDELGRVLRAKYTMQEFLSREYDPRDWLHFIGVDPARAPGGDWFAAAVGGLPRRPTRPWYNVPFWVGQVQGTNLVDVFASLTTGPLRRFKSFHTMAIDDSHDYTFTDLMAKRYTRRVMPIKYTSHAKEDMWKLHYLMHKIGRMYPGQTMDQRLNENMAILRRQIDRAEVSFLPSGKLRVSHRKKEHDDALDADVMQCYASYRYMRMYAMKGTAHVARARGAPSRQASPASAAAAADYGDMMAMRHTLADQEAMAW